MKLNDRQLAVLQRIGAGEEPVTARSSELARTVYALRDRRLVTTPRTDGVWIAQLTEAGRFYLDHGRHAGQSSPAARSREQPATPRPAAARAIRDDDLLALGREMIERVQESEGTLRIDNPDAATRSIYRRVIHAVKQHGLVPQGFRLLHTGRNAGDLIIHLSDDARTDETEWNRIRLGVRDQVSGTPLLDFLRTAPAVLEVSDDALPRALDIVDALARHARRRGHLLALSRKKKHRGLYLQVGGHRCRVTVSEEQDQLPRYPVTQAPSSRAVYAWQRVHNEVAATPSGRLRVELPDSPYSRCSRWADDGRSRLENSLCEVVTEVERRCAAAEQAHREWQRQHDDWVTAQEHAEAEKRALWAAAMQQAHASAVTAYRTATLADALHHWQTANAIRTFCAALERATATGQLPEAGALPEWIAWGCATADNLDPTCNPQRLAQVTFDRQPLPDELRPYLGDWSPHGPAIDHHVRQSEPASSTREFTEPGALPQGTRTAWC